MKHLYMIALVGVCCTSPQEAARPVVIEDLGKSPEIDTADFLPGLFHHIETARVHGGNTSIRNVPAENLRWKGSRPDANGRGYYQRNRDLGQVFSIPEGADVQATALTIRTSRGNNALMQGAPGAAIYVQFFQVTIDEAEFRINENNTEVGDSATHGFDEQYNRADDFIEGVQYTPIQRITGGTFPDVPPTTQSTYQQNETDPFGEQEGHLRFIRFDFGDQTVTLETGRQYAWMVGFDEPCNDCGIALANVSHVAEKKSGELLMDPNGFPWWSIRREGDGTLPPTMIPGTTPPSDPTQREQLIRESLFEDGHWNTLPPTSNGYPDVDTYRTFQFYLETKPVRDAN